MQDAREFEALRVAVKRALQPLLKRRLTRLQRAATRHDAADPVAALRALVLRGGKRQRAALAVAGFAAVAPLRDPQPALHAAAAIELLQAYLLIQDDWMDDDRLRRGDASVHHALAQRYADPHRGAASAILASDLAWSEATDCLRAAEVSAARRLAALDALSAAHRDVIFGQQIDLQGVRDVRSLEKLHALKTASYTLRAPLLIGACLAGASREQQQALRRFAKPLGIAFQLRDDLLGTFASQTALGKVAAGDVRAGKRTAVTLAAEELLDRRARVAWSRVFGVAAAGPEELAEALHELVRCGVRQRVSTRMRTLRQRARRYAEQLPIRRQARVWLRDAVEVMASEPPT